MPDATFTVTLHLMWLWWYFAIGIVVWLPMEYAAWRTLASRDPFWRTLRHVLRGRPYWPAIAVAAWPLGLWEVVR